MATIRLIPSTYYLSNTNYLSISNANNMYANTDSTTYATITNTRTSTTSYYLYIRGFDFDSVPSDAIVSSITIKLKAYHSGGNTSTIGGYNNTTSVSSAGTTTALSTSATVKTFTNTTIAWDTLKNYGNDFGIRINCRRSNRNTTSYIYIYGAEIEVTYTVPVYHTVTSSTNAGTIVPSGSQSVLEGESYTLSISGISPHVTDNGVDVTSQVIKASSGTTILIPESNTSTGFTVTNINNAYDDASSTTYATLDLGGGGSTGTMYLELGGTVIPFGATIQSISCDVTLAYRPNGSSSGYTGSCQLYSGSTAKGSSWTFASGSTAMNKTTHAMTIGTWSASELANARLYIHATNNASSTHRYIDVYGVSFSVTYEVSGDFYTYTISSVMADHTIVVTAAVVSYTIYRKVNNTWTTINYTKVYKKVNGAWVEQSDPSTAFDSNTNYVWSQ